MLTYVCAELEQLKMSGVGLEYPELQEEVLEEELKEYTDKMTEQTAKAQK